MDCTFTTLHAHPLLRLHFHTHSHMFLQEHPLERVECLSSPVDSTWSCDLAWLMRCGQEECVAIPERSLKGTACFTPSLCPDNCCPSARAPVGAHTARPGPSPPDLQAEIETSDPLSHQLKHSLVNLRINAYRCNMPEFGDDLLCGPKVAIAGTLLFISSELLVATPTH